MRLLACWLMLVLTSTSGAAPLHRFLQQLGAAEKIVKLLLDRHANPNLGRPVSDATRDPSILRMILDAGADIDASDEFGRTALSFAADLGNLKGLQLLLDRGARVDAVRVSGFDFLSNAPLVLASSNGHEDIVQTLLAAGANVNGEDNRCVTALEEASLFGHHKVVQMLIHAGADVNSCNAHGQSALWIASERGDHKTAQILIDAGADINSQNNTGITPLQNATASAGARVLRVLLTSGADQLALLREYHGHANPLCAILHSRVPRPWYRDADCWQVVQVLLHHLSTEIKQALLADTFWDVSQN